MIQAACFSSVSPRRCLPPVPAALTLACLLALYTGFAWVLGNERVRALEPFHPMASALTRTPL